MSFAVIYVNSHHNEFTYVKEANQSAQSFRRYLPDAKYYLFTDVDNIPSDYTDQFDVVNVVSFEYPDFMKDRVHLNGQMVAKHKAMQTLEEDVVMYVGADTYALKEEVAELPRILERFDVAAAHAPVRINTELGNSSIPEIPPCYTELNCDLILYKNTDKVRAFLERWRQSYLEDKFSHPHDQGTFRYELYYSDLSHYVLPVEYNYRGHEYREDTIILQNRFTLDQYIGEPETTSRKVKNKVKRLLGL